MAFQNSYKTINWSEVAEMTWRVQRTSWSSDATPENNQVGVGRAQKVALGLHSQTHGDLPSSCHAKQVQGREAYCTPALRFQQEGFILNSSFLNWKDGINGMHSRCEVFRREHVENGARNLTACR